MTIGDKVLSGKQLVANAAKEIQFTYDILPVLGRLYHTAFVRGYERGKQDEKDAKELDDFLAKGFNATDGK